MKNFINKNINKKLSKKRANSSVEFALLISVVVLAFMPAQPYIFRAIQGALRNQIDQMKEVPTFETVGSMESPNYVRHSGAGYDIFADNWGSSLIGHFESMRQTVNAGNTTMSFYRTATFSGYQNDPAMNTDPDKIEL